MKRLFAIAGTLASVSAADVTLQWDHGADAASYAITYGTTPGSRANRITTGYTNAVTITNLLAAKYYFTAWAYDTNKVESLPSNELAVNLNPASSPKNLRVKVIVTVDVGQ
jgi:hypothetical protein